MKQEHDLLKVKNEICCLFKQTQTESIANVSISYLENLDFFNQPASSRFHNAFEGGLALHSLNVYKLFDKINKKCNLGIPVSSVVFVSIFHDVCKAGAYVKNQSDEYYHWNTDHPKGHAKLSIERIEKFFSMTELENDLIKFHMGFYGTTEFLEGDNSLRKGEYSLVELATASNKNPAVSLFHWCDDFEAKFGEKYFEKKKLFEVIE